MPQIIKVSGAQNERKETKEFVEGISTEKKFSLLLPMRKTRDW